MCCTMAAGKSVCLLLALLALTSATSDPWMPQSKGRKLFGGYRIVPKVCRPTIATRVRSDEPAICMFNYECTRRNGEVVGACMDGFLFGACCQLPSKDAANGPLNRIPGAGSNHQIDHVPDIPILLNPDGTPIGITVPQTGSATKTGTTDVSNHLPGDETTYTKIPTFKPVPSISKPSSSHGSSHTSDITENAEKPQVMMGQADVSHIMDDFPSLLGQQEVLDDLRLPGLLTHSHSNNDIQDHQDTLAVNPVTTLLNPDQILQIADPVDQLPALFSQGLGQNNHSSADTILLNENGTALNEANNPDELFKPTEKPNTEHPVENKKVTLIVGSTDGKQRVTEVPFATWEKKKVTQGLARPQSSGSNTHWVRFPDRTSASTTEGTFTGYDQKFTTSSMSKLPVVTQMYSNTHKLTSLSGVDSLEKLSMLDAKVSTKFQELTAPADSTTPVTTLSNEKDELVKVPTITYDVHSGNKKDDVIEKEEIAINHIISILNNTTPGAHSVTVPGFSSSPVQTWLNVEKTSKPVLKISTPRIPSTTTAAYPYTFYRPAGLPSSYYTYVTVPTENYPSYSTSNHYTSSATPSTQIAFDGSSNFGYSTRPTTHPPAPTVIVLGPLGTEYTTDTTQKSVTRRPVSGSSRPASGSTRPASLSTRPPSSGSTRPSFVRPNSNRPSSATSRPTTAALKPVSGLIRPTPSPVKTPSVSTKNPSVSTTITHNISTVISNVATNNVVSTSFITVNMKDGVSPASLTTTNLSTEPDLDSTKEKSTTRRPTTWTTLSSWSDKPSFHLKPSLAGVSWPEDNMAPVQTIFFKDPSITMQTSTTTKTSVTIPCDDDATAAPDDLINFPPVRNPNLNTSAPISQQEKPTIIGTLVNTGYPDVSENDIPTPMFIEDDVLTNKVDAFVDKIVESLQGNFQELKDIVYNRQNETTPVVPNVTRRPTVASSGTPTKRPTRKPAQTAKPSQQITTRKPGATRRPTGRPSTQKPAQSDKPGRPTKVTTVRPRPPGAATQGVTTRKPHVTTTKRPRPTRRPTTTHTLNTEAVLQEDAVVVSAGASVTTQATSSSGSPDATSAPDFRTQCGVRPLVMSGRIVGGKGARFGEWPWQVLVREATWLGLFTKNKCGGVLITDRYVITAAHCQPGFLASLVAVLGEFDISGELESKRSVTRNVKRVIVNRGYDPATFENDLALLELETPVQFDAHIVPICMPKDGADFTGRMATVTGWGRLKYNGGVPSVLQEVQVPIMENAVCQEMFQTGGHSKLILDSFLCAGYANGQKDSCEGDSGGPLVMQRPDGRWFLVGTVSHGIKCAAPYLPGVYMRTTYFKPWLHSITGV